MLWVAILMGSESDWPVMESCKEVLDTLQIKNEVKVTSAHRTPKETQEYVNDAEERGCSVFICAAGMAAHLAGAVAAQTTRPVVGVPIDSGSLNGIDALLSTVQMPGGIPVATVAIGKAGAKNAAYLAAQILSVSNKDLHDKVREDRKRNKAKVIEQNDKLQANLT
jgi:phosphoribosylaminoimidazole carboxylase PurE protein